MPQKLNHRLPSAPSPSATRVDDTCLPWRALLPEAAEDLLDGFTLQALEQHLNGCAGCQAEMADAQRGLAWLAVLTADTPAPPDSMLANILSRTTEAPEVGVFLPEQPSFIYAEPDPTGSDWKDVLRWMHGAPGTWSSLLQPRLAMTGAMAFLSLCLTINLLGESLAQHNTGSGGLERTMTDTGASVVRSIHGLRVIYRVEARVNELRAEAGEASNAHSSD